MNIVQTMRWIVFLVLYASVITPLYLTLQFNTPAWLFLYAPGVAFWTVVVYTQIEGNQIVKNATDLEVHP